MSSAQPPSYRCPALYVHVPASVTPKHASKHVTSGPATRRLNGTSTAMADVATALQWRVRTSAASLVRHPLARVHVPVGVGARARPVAHGLGPLTLVHGAVPVQHRATALLLVVVPRALTVQKKRAAAQQHSMQVSGALGPPTAGWGVRYERGWRASIPGTRRRSRTCRTPARAACCTPSHRRTPCRRHMS